MSDIKMRCPNSGDYGRSWPSMKASSGNPAKLSSNSKIGCGRAARASQAPLQLTPERLKDELVRQRLRSFFVLPTRPPSGEAPPPTLKTPKTLPDLDSHARERDNPF